MLQNHATIKIRHNKFIKKVCDTEIVYALKKEDGYATSTSHHFENEDEEPIPIICFWAEKARAKSCIAFGWSDYEITEVPLSDFLENWCVGLFNDGLIIGTAFDRNMFGYEVEPLDLILDIISELKEQKKDLNLKKFEGIQDLENQVKSITES